jgi:hypothetical protein
MQNVCTWQISTNWSDQNVRTYFAPIQITSTSRNIVLCARANTVSVLCGNHNALRGNRNEICGRSNALRGNSNAHRGNSNALRDNSNVLAVIIHGNTRQRDLRFTRAIRRFASRVWMSIPLYSFLHRLVLHRLVCIGEFRPCKNPKCSSPILHRPHSSGKYNQPEPAKLPLGIFCIG